VKKRKKLKNQKEGYLTKIKIEGTGKNLCMIPDRDLIREELLPNQEIKEGRLQNQEIREGPHRSQ
jgi:DNA-binding protein